MQSSGKQDALATAQSRRSTGVSTLYMGCDVQDDYRAHRMGNFIVRLYMIVDREEEKPRGRLSGDDEAGLKGATPDRRWRCACEARGLASPANRQALYGGLLSLYV